MNGNISQQLALISFGNEYLKTGKLIEPFYPSNSTCQFCNTIRFIDFKKYIFITKKKEVVVADTPDKWFKYIKEDGCKKLGLYYEHSKNQSFAEDYKLAGFVGGGGVWMIEAIYEDHSNFWANRWTVSKKDAPDNKIWKVEYGAVSKQQRISNPQFDLVDVKNSLHNYLIKIRDFAQKHNLNYWTETFEKAINALNDLKPNQNYYHKDLIPIENYSLIAQQILFASGISFVFGGMGSWNDLGFEAKEDNTLYENLTSELYEIVIKGIIAATNNPQASIIY